MKPHAQSPTDRHRFLGAGFPEPSELVRPLGDSVNGDTPGLPPVAPASSSLSRGSVNGTPPPPTTVAHRDVPEVLPRGRVGPGRPALVAAGACGPAENPPSLSGSGATAAWLPSTPGLRVLSPGGRDGGVRGDSPERRRASCLGWADKPAAGAGRAPSSPGRVCTQPSELRAVTEPWGGRGDSGRAVGEAASRGAERGFCSARLCPKSSTSWSRPLPSLFLEGSSPACPWFGVLRSCV